MPASGLAASIDPKQLCQEYAKFKPTLDKARLVQRAAQTVAEQPTHVQYRPALGVLHVKGSGKLISHLLQQDEVQTTSANEATITMP